MKNFAVFIKEFLNNKGQYVFLSLLIAKICAFAGSLLIIRILPENEFGTLSIVASVFAIFAPFNGFGSTQALLRFGSVVSNESEKKELSGYLFKKGFLNQVFLSLLFLFVLIFYLDKYENIALIFLCFGVRLVGVFFLAHIQSELRIYGKNREFALVGNVVNIAGLLLIITLAFSFGIIGYLIAIMVSPFIALFWLKSVQPIEAKKPLSFSKKEIWSYAFHSAGTASLSDALFAADILLLGFLTNETAVANYKVAILIPSNLTFLALTFMQSDFPIIAHQYQNKKYLKNYILNYYKLFIPICILIFGLGTLVSKPILQVFFGEKYTDNTWMFSVFLAAFCINMLLRNLYGNLLAAVGKMSYNTITSVVGLLFLLLLGWIFTPTFGVEGMAAAMGLSLLATGVILMWFFFRYLQSLK